MRAAESATMLESFVSFLGPLLAACNGFELSCLCAGSFFLVLYLALLGLWIAHT
jgi:hypothetical protein